MNQWSTSEVFHLRKLFMNHCMILYVLEGEVNIVIKYDMPDESDSYLHLEFAQSHCVWCLGESRREVTSRWQTPRCSWNRPEIYDKDYIKLIYIMILWCGTGTVERILYFFGTLFWCGAKSTRSTKCLVPDAGSIFGQVFVVADGEFHVDDGIRIAMFVFFVEGQVWASASSMSTSHFIVIGGWCLLNDLSKHLQLSSPWNADVFGRFFSTFFWNLGPLKRWKNHQGSVWAARGASAPRAWPWPLWPRRRIYRGSLAFRPHPNLELTKVF